MSKEAMKQALEALKQILTNDGGEGSKCYSAIRLYDARILGGEAIKALEETLAKQEQDEPVACLHRLVDVTNPVVKSGYMCMDCKALFRAYATPQQRTWVGLTDEQIAEAVGWLPKHGCKPLPIELQIAKAIEAAHGIKE